MRLTFKKSVSIMFSVILIITLSITSISATTYYYDSNFEFYKNELGGITVSDFMLDNTVIDIPEELLDYTVTAIDVSAFSDDTDLKSVTIPSTVVSIGAFAFNNCKSLSDITFTSNNLSEIVMGAFQDCDSFVNIDLSNTSITKVSDQLFAKCDNLESVIIPDTAESIGSFAFYKCPKLNKVVIPNSVTTIASNAFKNSTANLTIYCYENSTAHTYAVEKNIPFKLIEEVNYELGDVDLNGSIDIKDATLIQKYLADIEMLDATQLGVADYNQDNQINIMDATEIQKYLVSY